MTTVGLNTSTTEYVTNPKRMQQMQSSTTVFNVPIGQVDNETTSVPTITPAQQPELTKEAILKQFATELMQAIKADPELKDINIDLKKLENTHAYNLILTLNNDSIGKLSEDKLSKMKEAAKEAILTALKDSVENGEVRYDKFIALTDKYIIAKNTGWNLDEYKNKVKEKQGASPFEILKKFDSGNGNRLAQYNSLKEVPQDLLKAVVKDFIHTNFLEPLNKAKQIEDPEKRNAAIEDIKGKQLKCFGFLISTTSNFSEEEINIFKSAFCSLLNENKDEVITTLESLKEIFPSICDAITMLDLQEILTKPDALGKLMSDSTLAKFLMNKSTNGIKNSHEEFSQISKNFFTENKDIIESIIEKEKNGITAFTDEEEKVKNIIDNFIKKYSSVEFAAVTLKDDIPEDVKNKLLALFNKDAYKLPFYKDILDGINEFFNNNLSETFSQEKRTSLNNILNQATQGNYEKAINGDSSNFTPPPAKNDSSSSEATTPDYGFATGRTADVNILQQKFFEYIIKPSENKENFTVEKIKPEKLTSEKAPRNFREKIATMPNNFVKLRFLANNMEQIGFGAKTMIANRLKILQHDNLIKLMSLMPESFILSMYKKVGLEEEDIDRLPITSGAKNIIRTDLQKTESSFEKLQEKVVS